MVSPAAAARPAPVRPTDDQIEGDVPPGEARAAVHVGLYVSALRCVLTYVVAPAVGAFGLVLGPVGTVLQVLGAVTATAGARRLWALRHRARLPYALLAMAVGLLAVYSVAGDVSRLLR